MSSICNILGFSRGSNIIFVQGISFTCSVTCYEINFDYIQRYVAYCTPFFLAIYTHRFF